jgi:hypothetical protein
MYYYCVFWLYKTDTKCTADITDQFDTWVYVEADNEYIARSLIYFYYSNTKEIQYIGKYKNLEDVTPPIHVFMDGYNKEIYEQFKQEYNYNF